MNRDFDAKPYSADELRVAKWFSGKGLGGGDDPIGAMIASHEHLAWERQQLRTALERIIAEADCYHAETLARHALGKQK